MTKNKTLTNTPNETSRAELREQIKVHVADAMAEGEVNSNLDWHVSIFMRVIDQEVAKRLEAATREARVDELTRVLTANNQPKFVPLNLRPRGVIEIRERIATLTQHNKTGEPTVMKNNTRKEGDANT